jgi:hypothetical protein
MEMPIATGICTAPDRVCDRSEERIGLPPVEHHAWLDQLSDRIGASVRDTLARSVDSLPAFLALSDKELRRMFPDVLGLAAQQLGKEQTRLAAEPPHIAAVDGDGFIAIR